MARSSWKLHVTVSGGMAISRRLTPVPLQGSVPDWHHWYCSAPLGSRTRAWSPAMSKVGAFVFLTDSDKPASSHPGVQPSHRATTVSPAKTLGLGKVSKRRLERRVA